MDAPSPDAHPSERQSPHPWSLEPVPEDADKNSANNESADKMSADKMSADLTRASFKAPERWMLAFGVLLATCAGAVNAVSFQTLGTFVSHVTGTTAKVGLRIEGVSTGANESWDIGRSSLLVVSFIFGSFLCGLVIPKGQVHFGGKAFYGMALVGNSALLVGAAFAAPATAPSGVPGTAATVAGCLAAMACGLQNAMCTMHFGTIVRTTHITGTATDIGSTAGRAVIILLRRGCRPSRVGILEEAELEVDLKKLQVLLPLLSGFLIGSISGAFLHSGLGPYAYLVPAGVTGPAGFAYMFFRKALKRIETWRLKAEISEMEDALERAHRYLRSGTRRRSVLENVAGQIENALEVIHDVEETLSEICASNHGAGEPPERPADERSDAADDLAFGSDPEGMRDGSVFDEHPSSWPSSWIVDFFQSSVVSCAGSQEVDGGRRAERV